MASKIQSVTAFETQLSLGKANHYRKARGLPIGGVPLFAVRVSPMPAVAWAEHDRGEPAFTVPTGCERTALGNAGKRIHQPCKGGTTRHDAAPDGRGFGHAILPRCRAYGAGRHVCARPIVDIKIIQPGVAMRSATPVTGTAQSRDRPRHRCASTALRPVRLARRPRFADRDARRRV